MARPAPCGRRATAARGPVSNKEHQNYLISVFLCFIMSASAVFNNIYMGLFRKIRDGEIRGQKCNILGGWGHAPVTGRFFFVAKRKTSISCRGIPGGEARRWPCYVQFTRSDLIRIIRTKAGASVTCAFRHTVNLVDYKITQMIEISRRNTWTCSTFR